MTEVESLDELAVRHGSDKWGSHHYTPHYDAHFSARRNEAIKLFEIGIGGYDDPQAGGGSLRMWRDYFRQASIVGLDFFDKSPHAGERIRVYQGDQSDAALLERISREAGPFDIVVDDGSHENAHVAASFRTLFPLLSPGGLYVVEDVQTSYWPALGGSATDFNNPGTTMGFFKSLLDGLNYREIPRPGYSPTYFDQHITSIAFYHNMVFVAKGDNSEESNTLRNFEFPAEHAALGRARSGGQSA